MSRSSRRKLGTLGARGTVAVGTVAVLAVGGIQLVTGSSVAQASAGLTPYEGCDALLAHQRAELRASATAYGIGSGSRYGLRTGDVAMLASADSAAAASAEGASGGSAGGAGGTGTNLQEQGVDEPDVAKLKDGRIVTLSGARLQVVSAEAKPRVVGTVKLDDTRGGTGEDSSGKTSFVPGGFAGGELLLVGDWVVAVVPGGDEPTEGVWRPSTHVVLVDLAGEQPRVLERAEYSGTYVSARLTGSTVRLVTDTRPTVRSTWPRKGGTAGEAAALAENRHIASSIELDDVLPRVTRTDARGEVVASGPAVACTSVSHPKEARGSALLTVTAFRPEVGLGATGTTGVVADGDTVYAAEDRIVVATNRWANQRGPAVDFASDTSASFAGPSDVPGTSRTDEVSTELHSFDTSSPDRTVYVGSGSVPGYLLSRWSLSWHEDALRVATTRQPPWSPRSDAASSSSIVKLAESGGELVETGRVDGLGLDEQIKSVRFMGDVAAVVTFRETDPLYLVDLAGKPRVLGELKIPGFSTYLHPIGDGRLLALGYGGDTDRFSGMRMVQASVFDIGDLSRPTLVDRLDLGAGYAPALDESRAFSYDPERRTLYLGFTTYGRDGLIGPSADVIGVAVAAGGDLAVSGRLSVREQEAQGRVLLDGDRFYAVGASGVEAADSDTFASLGSARF